MKTIEKFGATKRWKNKLIEIKPFKFMKHLTSFSYFRFHCPEFHYRFLLLFIAISVWLSSTPVFKLLLTITSILLVFYTDCFWIFLISTNVLLKLWSENETAISISLCCSSFCISLSVVYKHMYSRCDISKTQSYKNRRYVPR